jgi:hypothetical protein
MKITNVKRYNCDFCGKTKYSKPAMNRHERGCTKNPNRVCHVCQIAPGRLVKDWRMQKPIAELMALLPDPKAFINPNLTEDAWIQDGLLRDAVNAALPELRKACENCPACIMAALRQKGIPVPLATDFNFTDEMKDIWSEINSAQYARDSY